MSRNEKGKVKSSLDGIGSVLCQIDSPAEMKRLLGEILTPAEQSDLGLRWQLMEMLVAGIPQRQIAAELGISLCKITRGAKILKDENAVSKQYLNTGEHDG
ncbi:MAG: Trp family transcriptional regulator [Planctomycetota bacterium]|jgi:TrpR family trp operon transcriptional repressor